MRDLGREGDRIARRRSLQAAVVVLLLLSLAVYLAFVKATPLSSEFEIRGIFSSATQLKPGSEVRRSGVRIGEVTGVDAGPDGNAVVTMQIDDASELNSEIRLSIVPRLLFEGNFYVDVEPGPAGSPDLSAGETVPRARTSVPVQIDQVLSTFDSSTRRAMTSSFSEWAEALGGPPGRRGDQGLRNAVVEFDRALDVVEQTAQGLRGTEDGDLRRAIASSGRFTGELAADPNALAGIVTDFDRVAGALASDQQALASTVRELDRVLRVAPTSLTAIDRVLPALTEFGAELEPALEAMPSSLNAGTKLVHQIDRLVAPEKLPALLDAIEPFNVHVPPLAKPLAESFTLAGHLGRCLNNTVLPALNTEIQDGPNTTGYKIWQDTLHLGANLLGSSAGFDGNGGTLRLGLTFGLNQLQGVIPGVGEIVGGGQIEGVNPIWLGAGADPEFRPDQWCETQQIPDYEARSRIGTPAWLEESPAYEQPQKLQDRLEKQMALFTGSAAERRKLLDWLLKGLPDSAPQASGGSLAESIDPRSVRDRLPAAPTDDDPPSAGGGSGGGPEGSEEPGIPGGGGSGPESAPPPRSGGGPLGNGVRSILDGLGGLLGGSR